MSGSAASEREGNLGSGRRDSKSQISNLKLDEEHVISLSIDFRTKAFAEQINCLLKQEQGGVFRRGGERGSRSGAYLVRCEKKTLGDKAGVVKIEICATAQFRDDKIDGRQQAHAKV